MQEQQPEATGQPFKPGTGAEPGPDPGASVHVDIVLDPTLSAAAVLNGVPVLRSMTLRNQTASTLTALTVCIRWSPAVVHDLTLVVDALPAGGEPLALSPVLTVDHDHLHRLDESTPATVRVEVLVDGRCLGSGAATVEVLTREEWPGERAMPELLAAFCLPNHPDVDRLLGEAALLLRRQAPALAFDGYQSLRRDVVWQQVSALWNVLLAAGLNYAVPPASFETGGQKIRLPDRILDSRLATCIDLALLLAALLEQAGLRPLILLAEGHAWAGVWLHPAGFAEAVEEDLQAVRKRVASGELLVFETTLLTQGGGIAGATTSPTLRQAVARGEALLGGRSGAHTPDAEGFRFALDIHRCRQAHIRPLPSRSTPLNGLPNGLPNGEPPAMAQAPLAIEAMPELPPLDPLTDLPLPQADGQTPAARLTRWKSRLLDLTLRNRLLNFRPRKTTLQIAVQDLARLEDALAEGADFRFSPPPATLEKQDPLARAVDQSSGNTALERYAREALGRGELLVRLPRPELDGQLQAIWHAARENLEEGGANTLFLALGFLEWTQAEAASRRFLAPVLLVPVSLERPSVRSGYRLRRHDDEAIVNPTLLEHLRATFDLELPGIELLPADDKGMDVQRILQSVRLAIAGKKHWEVREDVWLGHFSFTKYLMWKDLEDRADVLRRNEIVRHLIEHAGEPLPQPVADPRLDALDRNFPPQDLLVPLLADSSQQQAVCEVDAGHNLVLEGPPGTGKSQTIANLIAHMLARGKSVLFVSEKMAALDVVQRRLAGIGLAPFCLELHSAKARKTELLRQLGQSLAIAGQQPPESWQREADRLGELRSTLNALVEALHRRYPNGLSVFAAIGSGGTTHPQLAFGWSDPEAHDVAALDAWRLLARRMATLGGALSGLNEHPLRLIGRHDWSPSLQEELRQLLEDGRDILGLTTAAASDLATMTGLDVGAASLDRLQALAELAEVLDCAGDVPPGLFAGAADPGTLQRLASLVKHGRARGVSWSQLQPGWAPAVTTLHASILRAEWTDEAARWWPRAWFGQRAIRRRLAAVTVDGRMPSRAQVESLLEPLAGVNEEDGFLRGLAAPAGELLGSLWQEQATDWDAVENLAAWAARYSRAIDAVVQGDAAARAGLVNRLTALYGRDGTGTARSRVPAGWTGAWARLHALVARLTELAAPLQSLWGDAAEPGALGRLQTHLDAWQSSLRQLSSWCQWRKVRDEADAAGLSSLVAAVESGAVELAATEPAFESAYRAWWLRKAIDRDPVLRTFSRADHERSIEEFRQADARFQKLTEAWVVATLSARLPRPGQVPVGADSEMGVLQRELAKQRRHLPVRQLVKALPTLLPRLKPCLLMSPLSVAQYLDAGYAPFDLVVFDEASQIPVWDAIGVIARGRQVVVVGDPRQLPPTRFFDRDVQDEDDYPDVVDDLESILDECLGAGMYRRSLTWHYRSRHESLITFSNRHYYEGRLNTFPSPVTTDRAVRLQPVAGLYERGGSRTNPIEARAVVTAIETHFLASRNRVPSLGVVTFNQPQQQLIERLLDERRAQLPALDNAIAAASDEPLFIKNLENVQGDERDLIFFSVTYGLDAGGRMSLNFGPLNGDGGHRRLNVAITRAREAVVVFSSLAPEQIDLARVRARGVQDLRHYLDYARSRTLPAPAMPALVAGGLQVQVAQALEARGFHVDHAVGTSGWRVDLGVVDPRESGRYIAGIECDGEGWRDAPTARDRDRLREHVLTNLGWTVLHVWSMEWWLDPEPVIDRLVARISVLASQPLRESEPAFAEPATPAIGLTGPLSLPQAGTDSPADAEPLTEESLTEKSLTEKSLTEKSLTEKVPTLRVDAPPPAAAPAGLPQIDRDTMRAALRARLRDRARQRQADNASDDLPGEPVPVPGLPVFKPAVLRQTSSKRFNEPQSERLITTTLRLIIEAEGPVAESVLLKKASRAWGFDRSGVRINQRFLGLIPEGCSRTEDDDEPFWWPAGIDPHSWTGFRVAGEAESSRRSIYETAREEIVLLIRHVLDAAGASSREDLARSVCRLLGMTRTTADAEVRVLGCVDRMLAAGELEAVGDRVRRR